MSKLQLTLGLCGMAERDERMIATVLSRFAPKNFDIKTSRGPDYGFCQIALVNLDSLTAIQQLQRIRQNNPSVHLLEVSNDGAQGSSLYRIASRSLLFQLMPMLEKIAALIMQQMAAVQQSIAAVTDHVAAPNPVNTANEPVASVSTPTPTTIPTITRNIASQTAATVSSEQVFRDDPVIIQAEPALTALIVDDSDTVRTQLKSALLRIGIKGEVAISGEQALQRLENEEFDLVFLDVVMPGEDGYTICKKIRKNPQTRNQRVIMLTSRSSPFDRARGALAGCDTYLTKPIDSKAFYAAVDKSVMKICQNNRVNAAARGYLLQTI